MINFINGALASAAGPVLADVFIAVVVFVVLLVWRVGEGIWAAALWVLLLFGADLGLWGSRFRRVCGRVGAGVRWALGPRLCQFLGRLVVAGAARVERNPAVGPGGLRPVVPVVRRWAELPGRRRGRGGGRGEV